MASASERISPSFMFLWKLLQLLQPIKGVCARPLFAASAVRRGASIESTTRPTVNASKYVRRGTGVRYVDILTPSGVKGVCDAHHDACCVQSLSSATPPESIRYVFLRRVRTWNLAAK